MIREVQPADFCQLVPLYEQLGYPVDELELINRLEHLLLHEDYHLLVLESNGEIKGFLGYAKMYFFEHTGFYFRVLALVIDEKNRRQGLASSLLEYLKGQAISNGAQAIALNSGLNQKRQNAHNFYEQFGFEKSSMGFRYSIESKLNSD